MRMNGVQVSKAEVGDKAYLLEHLEMGDKKIKRFTKRHIKRS